MTQRTRWAKAFDTLAVYMCSEVGRGLAGLTPHDFREIKMHQRRKNAEIIINDGVSSIYVQPDMMDKLIIWRLGDPRFAQHGKHTEEDRMQRQWCIEARADFADRDKNDMIDKSFREAAAHINATLLLLSDGQKPQVVCYSDDFFSGHQEIGILPDTLGLAKQTEDVGQAPLVSDEMLKAALDMQLDKGK